MFFQTIEILALLSAVNNAVYTQTKTVLLHELRKGSEDV